MLSVNGTEHALNVNLSFDLFCKYERTVHKSTENEFSDYNSFLVTSPIKVSTRIIKVWN